MVVQLLPGLSEDWFNIEGGFRLNRSFQNVYPVPNTVIDLVEIDSSKFKVILKGSLKTYRLLNHKCHISFMPRLHNTKFETIVSIRLITTIV